MIIASASIEHSGSRFVIDLFQGFEHRQPHQSLDVGDVIVHTHFSKNESWGKFEQILERYRPPVVVPLRKLSSVFLSWEARGKNLNDLSREIATMVSMGDHNPYWLPIDHVSRDLFLKKINDDLGLSLNTAWPIVGSDNKTHEKTEHEIQDKEGFRMLKEAYGWFFDRIYRA